MQLKKKKVKINPNPNFLLSLSMSFSSHVNPNSYDKQALKKIKIIILKHLKSKTQIYKISNLDFSFLFYSVDVE